MDADEVRDGARGRVHNDEAGRPVAITGRIFDTGYWTDHRIAAIPVLNAGARELAPRLVGLTKSRAHALVDEHEGITVEFRDAGATQKALYAVVGGTFAHLRDGRVLRVD